VRPRILAVLGWMLVLAGGIVHAQAPAPTVEGRVVGPDGRPLAGAIVAIVPVADADGAQTARTSPDGRFRISAPAGKAGLTVTAPGHLPHFRVLDLAPGAASQPLEAKLDAGGHRVDGTVIPAPGKNLAGLRLGFIRISEDEGDVFFAEVSEGRFAVTLAPGNYVVTARAKDQSSVSKQLSVTGDVKLVKIFLAANPEAAGPEVRAWIRKQAVPLATVEAGHGFDDLAPLASVVGGARVVALGEATHGTREFFQLKHRMLEFLAEKMGFTVFAIEANLPEAFVVNEYVLTGKGDPAQALAGLYFWTWNTEEVLELIRWMRHYNEDPAHARKLKFYGFDMQTPKVAYAQAKAYLDQVDAEGAALMEQTLKAAAATTGAADRAAARGWREAAVALIARIDSRREGLVAAAGVEAFERQRQNVVLLSQFAAMEADEQGAYRVRDESMAANVRWILEQEKGARVVLWAHNGHVSFQPGAMAGVNSMGWHLRQALGHDYLVFGFAFGGGEFQAIDYGTGKKGLIPFAVTPQPLATLNEALASAGRPVLALDLRPLPTTGPVKAWFDAPQGAWSIGAVFDASRPAAYVQSVPATAEYDAILYVDKTTTARANPSGRRTGSGASVTSAAVKLPANLGFEEGDAGKAPTGWFASPSQAFTATVSTAAPKDGTKCLQVAFKTGEPAGWYSVMQAVDPTPYRGKKIRVTGWVRTDGSPGAKAGLWVRVDRPGGMGFFDNMQNRPITSSSWTEAVIEGVVDEDARALNFGCLVTGDGTTWFDAIRIEVLEPSK
jgi:erythromycin esterase